jgi:hypothetical protein
LGKGAKVAIGLALLIIVPAVATTLAGSITIGSGPIAFGQGVVQAVACDSAITLTPTTSVVNVEGAGSFKVQTIELSDIANACSGKTFKVQAFGDTGAALTLSASGTGSPACIASTTLSGATWGATTSSNDCVGAMAAYGTPDANTLTFTPGTVLNAATVFKFTLETV